MAKLLLALVACVASVGCSACYFAIDGDTERTASAASPLCRAVIQRDFTLLEAELSRRADPNGDCGPFGNSLQWTIMRWDESSPRIMRRLLTAGADPNRQSSYRWPPLMTAVATGRREAVEILLDAGAAVNAGSEHDSPLNVACYRHDVPMVELLLARGASLAAGAQSGRTPLHAAAFHADLVKKFLALGADVNARDRSGATPLMSAVYIYAGAAVLPVPESVPLLLAAGADIHARDSSGRTALIHAVLTANRPAVEALINAGARTDERDNSGHSALALLEAQRAARPFSFHFWKLLDSGLRRFDRREIETLALLRSHVRSKSRCPV